jgi:serine/threonine protein kinase
VGKKYCMSPEMLNSEAYNFKSDIWALGILFVELLTGKQFKEVENKIPGLLADFP